MCSDNFKSAMMKGGLCSDQDRKRLVATPRSSVNFQNEKSRGNPPVLGKPRMTSCAVMNFPKNIHALRYSYSRPPFHFAKHHLFHQSVVFHSAYVAEYIQLPFLYALYDVSLAYHSCSYLLIRNFQLSSYI